MIKTNEYHEGKIKSLGQEVNAQPFTVGVMEPGEYTFATSTKEHMEIVFGEMEAKLPGGSFASYKKGESFDVDANVEFNVKLVAPVAYLCLYT
jgi:uncharacterized protein YaiE (UPF0345 family)